MEFLIVVALIAILLLCLGFTFNDILMMLAALVCILIILVGVFFAFSLVVLLSSRKTSAKFLRISEEGRFPCAVYKIGDDEIKNLFPSEAVMKKMLYVPEKDITVRKCAFIKAVLDKNALMTIALGSAVFIPLSAGIIFAAKWFFGF